MKALELREKTADELQVLLVEQRRKQFGLRMQNGSGQSTRGSDVKDIRRDIARIKTIMNEQRQAKSGQ